MKRFFFIALLLSNTHRIFSMDHERIIRGLIFLRLLYDNGDALDSVPRPNQEELKKMLLAQREESQKLQKEKMRSKQAASYNSKRKSPRQRESYKKRLGHKW